MRPLTTEEREWLSQYYQEGEHGKFASNPEIEAETAFYKELRTAHNKARKDAPEELPELKKKLRSQYQKLEQLWQTTNTFYDTGTGRREVGQRGNERRGDIYNRAKSVGRLVAFDPSEYDKFVSEAENEIDYEDLKLDEVLEESSPKKRPASKRSRRA